MGKYDDRPYPVGKGKPPKEHHWKSGKSGNPKGRPSRVANTQGLSERLRRMGDELVTGTVNGKPTRMTLTDALLRSCFVGLLSATDAQKLKGIAVFESLGMFQVSPEDRGVLAPKPCASS